MPLVNAIKGAQLFSQTANTIAAQKQRERLEDRRYALASKKFEADEAEAQRIRAEQDSLKYLNSLEAGRMMEADSLLGDEQGTQRIMDSIDPSERSATSGIEAQGLGPGGGLLGGGQAMPKLDVVLEEMKKRNARELESERALAAVRTMGAEHGRRYLQDMRDRRQSEAIAGVGRQVADNIQDTLLRGGFNYLDEKEPNEVIAQRLEVLSEMAESGQFPPDILIDGLGNIQQGIFEENKKRLSFKRGTATIQGYLETYKNDEARSLKLESLMAEWMSGALSGEDRVDKAFEIVEGRQTARAANAGEPLRWIKEAKKNAIESVGGEFQWGNLTLEEQEASMNSQISLLTGGAAVDVAGIHRMFGSQALATAMGGSDRVADVELREPPRTQAVGPVPISTGRGTFTMEGNGDFEQREWKDGDEARDFRELDDDRQKFIENQFKRWFDKNPTASEVEGAKYLKSLGVRTMPPGPLSEWMKAVSKKRGELFDETRPGRPNYRQSPTGA